MPDLVKLNKNLKSLQFILTYLLPLEESLHLCIFPLFKDASSLVEISPIGVGEDTIARKVFFFI